MINLFFIFFIGFGTLLSLANLLLRAAPVKCHPVEAQ